MTPKVLNWPKVGVQHARNVLLEPERASSSGEVRKFYQPIKQCLSDSWPQEKIMAGVLRHKNGSINKISIGIISHVTRRIGHCPV